jgi:asparagine synthase (glutamine-hydrolysing)
MLYLDTKLWLPDDLLARGDKTAMAASVEARVPLLDHRLVEFAATLPPNLKLRRLKRKFLLKQVAREFLPPEIVDRRKRGFPAPFGSWFRNGAREFVRDVLAPATIVRRGLLDGAYVERLLAEHERRHADHAALIWGLVNLELWHRLYIDGDVRGRLARQARRRSGVES